MKITLEPTQFVFTPSLNRISFANMGGAFKPERLLAVTNITTGKLIYAVASQPSGFSGTFSTGTYTNDRLTYASSNAGQSASDIIEVLYDSETQAQIVSGTIASYTYDGNGNIVGSVQDPVSGDYKLLTASTTYAADGTPILSTVDPMTGGDGLNFHLQSSSYGGQVGNPIPLPNNNNALSVGFLNNGVLVTPALDPVSNQLIVQSAGVALQDVNLTDVDGAAISLGQKTMANSLPVTIASNQTAIPITAPTPINVNVAQSVSQDILGVAIGGNRNNQIEISFNTAPGAALITNSFTGSGAVSITNGHSIYSTGATGSSSARAVSVQETIYRPLHEIYAAFTAAFLNPSATCQSRIGLFDASNGFAIGYDGLNFSIFVRKGGSESGVVQSSWNTDILQGQVGSKFTRNGAPEALNKAVSNLFRIRFAWLGSANIFFEVFSPDGEWVLFHNIRQPNTSYDPSIVDPNLPMTLEVIKTSGATNSSIATACWGAGTTSTYAPITETLNDKSLAALTRSVITGESSAGPGSFVNVKVQNSGALVTHINGTPDFNIAQYGGAATTLGAKASGLSIPVAISSETTLGAINIVAGFVALNLAGETSFAVDVRGTFSGTLRFEGSINGGTNFNILPAVPYGSIANATLVTTTTAAGAWLVQCAGCDVVRVVATAFSSGSATVKLRAVQSSAWTYNAPMGATNAVSGTLTSVGTVTTVTGVTTVGTVTTVSGVTSAAIQSASVTDVSTATVNTSTNSSNVVVSNTQSAAFGVLVAWISGSGSIDVFIQESVDNGGIWLDTYQFNRITLSATGSSREVVPPIKMQGTLIRYRYVVTGTVSFAVTLQRQHRGTSSIFTRRLLDRAVSSTATGRSANSLYSEGCDELVMTVSMNAGGSDPSYQLEGSEDAVNWFTIGSALSCPVGTTVSQSYPSQALPEFLAVNCTVAGAASSLNYVCLRARGNA